MAQSLEELRCYAAEGPGMFQYIPPVASVTPASIQLGQSLVIYKVACILLG